MGQGSHSSLYSVLTQGSLIPAPELFWVRTCSLDKTGVRWPLLPPRRRTPGARQIASGSPRWRRTVQCWLVADGGQATSRATLMCLGRLAHTAKVTLLDLCGRRAARREAAFAGHRPSCGAKASTRERKNRAACLDAASTTMGCAPTRQE
jgi:hypothetical protein